MTITLDDYYMGRDKQYPDELTEQLRCNAAETVARANLLLSTFKAATSDTETRKVASGWRPAAINAATAGAAAKSKHMTCQAIDISDPEGDLDEWCLKNQGVLGTMGLWLEHPSATKGWCHVQIVAPKSGNRVFYP